MTRKPLISFRVSKDILEKIENTGIPKAKIVNQALDLYFNSNSLQFSTQNENNSIPFGFSTMEKQGQLFKQTIMKCCLMHEA